VKWLAATLAVLAGISVLIAIGQANLATPTRRYTVSKYPKDTSRCPPDMRQRCSPHDPRILTWDLK
jgi:hypothetical protein